jgi:hypothetical protein
MIFISYHNFIIYFGLLKRFVSVELLEPYVYRSPLDAVPLCEVDLCGTDLAVILC